MISPQYSFEEFCLRVSAKDPLQVIDAAGQEGANARGHHRYITKGKNFRKGSKGWTYCENLKGLVSMVMNGSVPPYATEDFLAAAQPLMVQLLRKWQIGSLRHVFIDSPQAKLRRVSLPEGADHIVVLVSRAEIEAIDILPALGTLRRLTEAPETAREFFERVDIAFHGYDDDTRELSEIIEVRNFVFRLDDQFPFWLFFLSKHYLGLQCLLWCLLLPSLTEEGRSEIFPERIDRLLTNRWFPAMNQICHYARFSEQQIEALTDRVLTYITKGRLPLVE